MQRLPLALTRKIDNRTELTGNSQLETSYPSPPRKQQAIQVAAGNFKSSLAILDMPGNGDNDYEASLAPR
jgi:hypothetical protein